MNVIIVALEQALILTPLVFGMYLSYRILRITDLSVDGTYVLGAAIFARTIEFGLINALIASMIGGIIVGNIVAYMQRNNVVNDLIVGVLVSFMLYSINLQILGFPNISLLNFPTILSYFAAKSWILPLVAMSVLIMFGLYLLLTNRLGLFLRAFGYNQKLLKTLGKSPEKYRILALSLSGGLAALSGTISSQVNGFADINMGFGVALIGIGAVVIGRQLMLKDQVNFSPLIELISCFVGIFLYFLCLSVLIRIGVNPINLKLILGIVLFFTLTKGHKKI